MLSVCGIFMSRNKAISSAFSLGCPEENNLSYLEHNCINTVTEHTENRTDTDMQILNGQLVYG